MNTNRLNFVKEAFSRMDRTGDGVITVDDMEKMYDPSFSPDVLSGKISKAEALAKFLDTFDTIEKDGIVTFEEFCEYYQSISASIDDDSYFELMMRNAWHISGGRGQSANTSNRRVLITHKDGTQSVQEVRDDFLVKGKAEVKSKLAQQGHSDVKDIGYTYGSDNTSKAKNPSSKPHSLSLAWEASTTPTDDVQRKRQKERIIRTRAAEKVQSLARARRGKREVSTMRRKQKAMRDDRELLEREEEKRKNRIKRPVGKSWW